MSKEDVEVQKAALVARGEDLSGPCGALKIIKAVAWALRDQGAGLLSKPTGNNCEGYAVDIIVFKDGNAFDVLTDSGGENGPAWNAVGRLDPARWRPPIDPGGTAPTTGPTPAPASGHTLDEVYAGLGVIASSLLNIDQRLTSLQARTTDLNLAVEAVMKKIDDEIFDITPIEQKLDRRYEGTIFGKKLTFWPKAD